MKEEDSISSVRKQILVFDIFGPTLFGNLLRSGGSVRLVANQLASLSSELFFLKITLKYFWGNSFVEPFTQWDHYAVLTEIQICLWCCFLEEIWQHAIFSMSSIFTSKISHLKDSLWVTKASALSDYGAFGKCYIFSIFSDSNLKDNVSFWWRKDWALWYFSPFDLRSHCNYRRAIIPQAFPWVFSVLLSK